MNPTHIEFDVFGTPKGQPRPKAFSRGGHARVYDPGTAEGWKGCIAMAADAYKGLQLPQPLAITMRFRFPRPKSHFRGNGELKPTAPVYFTGKPDFDNLEKAVADCLTQLGVWKDDAQVCENHGTYRYTAEGESPGCHITISEPCDRPTKTGWQPVSFAADCHGSDQETGEPGDTCSICGLDYNAACQCPGPTQDGYQYEERNGKLHARSIALPDFSPKPQNLASLE